MSNSYLRDGILNPHLTTIKDILMIYYNLQVNWPQHTDLLLNDLLQGLKLIETIKWAPSPENLFCGVCNKIRLKIGLLSYRD